METLSEYERVRLHNIAENHKQLVALGLEQPSAHQSRRSATPRDVEKRVSSQIAVLSAARTAAKVARRGKDRAAQRRCARFEDAPAIHYTPDDALFDIEREYGDLQRYCPSSWRARRKGRTPGPPAAARSPTRVCRGLRLDAKCCTGDEASASGPHSLLEFLSSVDAKSRCCSKSSSPSRSDALSSDAAPTRVVAMESVFSSRSLKLPCPRCGQPFSLRADGRTLQKHTSCGSVSLFRD